MSATRFDLVWSVPKDGFRWVLASAVREGVRHTGRALVAAPSSAAEEEQGPPPADPQPVLFRLLADVPPGEEGVLAFANRYGNLFGGEDLSPARRAPTGKGFSTPGVFLDSWLRHIDNLRSLIALWDLIQKGDEEGLAPHIQWRSGQPEGPAVVFVKSPGADIDGADPLDDDPAEWLVASGVSRQELLESFQPGDVVQPAKAYFQQRLDDLLFHVADPVKVGMSWDPVRGQPVIAYQCPTLMSAVWLQFATVVSENLTFVRCRECDNWFEVAPNAARASRRFCSDGCRSKAYRKRQDVARQMHAAGKGFEEIAGELESDVPTVKKWITGMRG
jgi:hypothetical protein